MGCGAPPHHCIALHHHCIGLGALTLSSTPACTTCTPLVVKLSKKVLSKVIAKKADLLVLMAWSFSCRHGQKSRRQGRKAVLQPCALLQLECTQMPFICVCACARSHTSTHAPNRKSLPGQAGRQAGRHIGRQTYTCGNRIRWKNAN
eukprot:1161571-Pelagomonas_calceolata.AAC.4